ncbi:O(6)-methylguanine-induced apoptosis 2 isoform X2 [Brachyhypopomus gauderio]|uniref:O(6)-methylguanine-induced apoptosis 2 isoform X2 n=1 Tax=Brachyhypopomus gauderio TaxID=698409 RepID=UPI004041F44C
MEKPVQRKVTEIYRFPGPSSIPTKYQTVVINNTEKKGFSSQTKRFTANTAVRAGRRPQRGVPGPNTYNLQSSLLRKNDFSRGVSRTFHQPIAVKVVEPLQKTPAPNQYNVCYTGVQVNSVVSAQSAFLSKTRRNSNFAGSEKGPSPCHYNVKETVTQKVPKVPVSCFKSTSARIQPLADRQVPGPGAYSPYQGPETVHRTIFPRRSYLGIAAPPVPLPKEPPPPGPGHYDIVDYAGPSKHPMAGAAFLSGTSRWRQETRAHSGLGPGSYEPDVLTKQSFLHNHDNIWIPA